THRLPAEAVVQPGVPKGTLEAVREDWAVPKVTVYIPTAYERVKRYPTIYTADGSAWSDLIRLPVILDNMIAARIIEPVIAVMIDAPANRSAWYQYNHDYLDYLERVVKYIDGHYATQ